MFINKMNWVFFVMLISSPMLAISSMNLFNIWVVMELNMILFIPMMYLKNNLSINSMIKYFIIQTFASNIFLMSYLLVLNTNYLSINFIILALSTKLGMAPFYFWFPMVAEGLSWFNLTLLFTWQKLIPLYALTNFIALLMFWILMASSLIGMFLMMNQTSLRKILAYSSMVHMSWMYFLLTNYSSKWILYFLIYSIIILSIYFLMKKENLSSEIQTFLIFNYFKKFSLTLTIFSLSGLPPFLGFFPKLMTIILSIPNYILLMSILIFSSLISIYIYTHIFWPIIFFLKKKSQNIFKKKYFFINFNSLLIIPLLPFMMT